MRLLVNNEKFDEFMDIAKELRNKDINELMCIFNKLDCDIKYKIKHTIAHNMSFNKVASDYIEHYDLLKNKELEFYKYHDMDKVITYFYMNKVDKTYHKMLAKHHNLNLKDINTVEQIKNDYEYFETIIDFECTLLSKPERLDNAYGIIERQYKGDEKVLSIIEDLGFTKDYRYKGITMDEHNNNIESISDDDVIRVLKESVEYLCA